jgi:hypothetical protein
LIGVGELLLAGPPHLDRVAAHHRGERGTDDLHGDARLAAEAPADVRGHDPHLVVREPECFGEQVALGVGRLGGAPHGEPSRRVHPGDHGVRLDRGVRVAGHRVAVLEHDVGGREAGVDVALAQLAPVSDVAVGLRVEPRHVRVVGEVGVEPDRVLGERVERVEDGGERLVGHRHPPGALDRSPWRAGHDRRDLLADEAHTVLREDVAVLHVQAERRLDLLAGHDRDDPRDLLGVVGVDREDAGVGVGTGDDLRVEQVGSEREVVDESCGAGELVDSVDARRGVTDVGEVTLRGAGRLAGHVTSPPFGQRRAGR